jgi:hypothetical protein
LTIAGLPFTVVQHEASAPTPPAPPGTCTYSVSPADHLVGAGGGSVASAVETPDGCAWTASTSATWVAVASGASGSGAGTLKLEIAPNPNTIERAAFVTVADQTVNVLQAGALPACSYAIAPTTASAPATGSTVSVAVTTMAGCTWGAASQDSWITFLSGTSATGSGTVLVAAAANVDTSARSGSATIAGQLFTFQQAGLTQPPPPPPPPSCSYALDRPGAAVPLLGGLLTVTVTTNAGCAWTATSHANWVTVTAGGAGTGNGQVQLLVAPLLLGSRTGTVGIGGQVFTVTQSGLLTAPGVAEVHAPAASVATR